MKTIKINANDCPINIIAENPEKFNGKVVMVKYDMMKKLIDEAKEAGKENVETVKSFGGSSNLTQINITIPGEVETKLSFIKEKKKMMDAFTKKYYLISVQADDILGCILNPNFKDKNAEVVSFDYYFINKGKK